MSRTFRNRSSVPHGWTVRDDGQPYHVDLPSRAAVREHCRSNGRWVRPPTFRRSPVARESATYRRQHQREYRARVRDRMRHGDYDNLPRLRRTSGWLTW